jgi:hypothetical protein
VATSVQEQVQAMFIVLVYSDRRVNAVYGWFADLDVVMFCSGGWPVVCN